MTMNTELLEFIIGKKPSGSTSTQMKIGEEIFYLRPDFLTLVHPNEVYRVLCHIAEERALKEAKRRLESKSANAFATYEDYRSYMQAVIEDAAKKSGFEFVYHDFLKPFLAELTAFFGGFHDRLQIIDPEKKVLIIKGDKGLSKTFLLRCFAKNPYQSYQFYQATDFEAMLKRNDYQAFEKAAFSWHIGHSPSEYFGQDRLAIMVDDAGTEERVNNFGNVTNPIRAIVEKRYEKYRYQSGLNLIITTNLSDDQMLEFYGSRVMDRLEEIATVYRLPKHESLRTYKQP